MRLLCIFFDCSFNWSSISAHHLAIISNDHMVHLLARKSMTRISLIDANTISLIIRISPSYTNAFLLGLLSQSRGILSVTFFGTSHFPTLILELVTFPAKSQTSFALCTHSP